MGLCVMESSVVALGGLVAREGMVIFEALVMYADHTEREDIGGLAQEISILADKVAAERS